MLFYYATYELVCVDSFFGRNFQISNSRISECIEERQSSSKRRRGDDN